METTTRRGLGCLLLAVVLTAVVHHGECQQRLRPGEGADQFQEESAQIYTTVFHKYNSKVRPLNTYPNPVEVEVLMELIHIRSFDMVKQELDSVVDIDIKWSDNRLTWYPKKVERLSTEPSRVWIPSIIYKNGVIPPSSLYSSIVTVSSQGALNWRRRENIITICHTKLGNDTQVCQITLAFTSAPGTEKFRNTTSHSIDPDFNNHHWDVIDVDTGDLDPVTDMNQFASSAVNAGAGGGYEVSFYFELTPKDDKELPAGAGAEADVASLNDARSSAGRHSWPAVGCSTAAAAALWAGAVWSCAWLFRERV